MATFSFSSLTRREALARMAAATGAAAAGFPVPSAAEALPETTSVRLLVDPAVPILCWAPAYLVEDFLRIEGFTDVEYAEWQSDVSETDVLAKGRADIATPLASDLVMGIAAEKPIVALAGLHGGCAEMFASDRVASIRDLAGKRIAINAEGGPEHIFIASIVAYVGLDPMRDIEWTVEPSYAAWPELLQAGGVDVVFAFPPANFKLRERGIGHVILSLTTDDPWRHFFCCMLAGRSDYVRRHPVATKRAMRAFIKANQLCDMDREGAARLLVERGATDRYDFALAVVNEVPYGAWRSFEALDTLRFFALRLHEAGLIAQTPSEIIRRGADFSHIDALRRELKT